MAADRLDQKGRIDQLIRGLSREGTIRVKELIESFEFFACIHKRVRAPRVVDLCAGHGLTGLLYGVFDREVSEVICVDREKPQVAGIIQDAVVETFPELSGRVSYHQTLVRRAGDLITPDAMLVAVHACGFKTDQCLDLAIQKRVPIAVLPCCYTGTGRTAPDTLRKSLGVPLATDVERTYRLEREGFRVEWDTISAEITPMNRVIIAHPDRT